MSDRSPIDAPYRIVGVPTTKQATCRILLSRDQCEALLAASPVGRLAVIVEGKPEIFPVNHVYDAATRSIAFPTHPGTKMEAALNWPSVGYEVDRYEPGGEAGWSVTLVGRAEEVLDGEAIRRFSEIRDVLWGEGPGTHWIRIVPTKVTGCEIQAMPATRLDS